MSDVIKPLPSGGEEVSVQAVSSAPKESKAADKIKKQLAEESKEELKKYNREAKTKQRKKDAAVGSVVGRKYFSTTEITKKQALEILERERLIRHTRVLEVCWLLAQVAARNLNIPLNAHLFTHGVTQTLEAIKTKQAQEPPSIDNVWLPGSRIRLHEEYALFDFATSWRVQPDGTSLSFESWRQLRRVCMTDVFRFGNEVFGMTLYEPLHGQWSRELFIQKNPDLLPEKYNWNDVKTALAGQSQIRQRLLMSNRSSFKSSYNLVDMLSWVLVFGGDLRILMCSATQPLSKGFLKKFKSYWTFKTDPTSFNQLYPEFMMFNEAEQGSEKNFVSPMRSLDLIEPTLNSVSIISEGLAGGRTDLLVMEDIAEISNSSTPEMREKTVLAVDMLRELVEPFGYVQAIGTPFAPGDVYSVMLDREEKRIKSGEEPKLLYQINPAWRVKEGIGKPPYDPTLTQEEVELTFPNRIGNSSKQVKEWFSVLKDKLRENVDVFRQQSLCEWVPDSDDLLKVQFDEEILRQHVRPPGYFDNNPKYRLIETVQATDVATSVARAADFSAICTARIYLDTERNKYVLAIVGMVMQRLRHSELGAKIIEEMQRWTPSRCLIERGGYFEALDMEIKKAAILRGLPIPYNIYWKPTQGANLKNKVARIKALETLLASDQLWFTHSTWTDSLINQFVRFDGVKRSGSSDGSKDDGPDAVSLLWEAYGPREFGEVKSEVQTELEEAALTQAWLRAQHQAYFGTQPGQIPVAAPVTELEPPSASQHYFGGLRR